MQHIKIHTRSTDSATVDGAVIHRGGYNTIHDAAIASAVTLAQDHGAPITALATDDLAGTVFWITVHPDGRVDPADPPADTERSTRRRRRRHEPADDVDEADFYDGPSDHQAATPDDAAASDHYRPPLHAEAPPYQPPLPPVAPLIRPQPPAPQPPEPAPINLPPAPPVTSPSDDTGPIPTATESVAPQPQPLGWQAPVAVPSGAGVAPAPHAGERYWGRPAHHPAGNQTPANSFAPAPPPAPAPTLADLRASRPAAPEPPATTGWRGILRRSTGGLLKLAPSAGELQLRRSRESVQRSLRGPKTVVVINTKGGGGKTTAVYSLSATFGEARGGYVLGWDNNETRGTLAWRAAPARHTNTAVDLLRDLPRFEAPRNARVGDLDNYVRSQGSAQFDVLASDEDAASSASIDGQAFRALHRSLSRFYRLIVVDTGNNVKAANWQAAVELADQLVVVTSIREDTAGGASWTLDHLTQVGLGDKVSRAITILSAPKAGADPDQKAMHRRLREHFGARTRAVFDVPYEPALVDGDSIVWDALSPATRQAWLIAAAAIADGL